MTVRRSYSGVLQCNPLYGLPWSLQLPGNKCLTEDASTKMLSLAACANAETDAEQAALQYFVFSAGQLQVCGSSVAHQTTSAQDAPYDSRT